MPKLAAFPLLALLSLAIATPAVAANAAMTRCEWRAPAHDPFVGEVPAAVDDYADIPAAVRERLKARMARFEYDDIVAIRRDAIEGNFRYEAALLDMHFGKQHLCREVTRQSWKPEHEERGLAYCEDGHCVVVPLVCRNVSRIVRRPVVTAAGGPAGQHGPLSFEPPAAGVPGAVESQEPPARTAQAAPPAAETLVPVNPALPSTPEPVAGIPPAVAPPESPALPPPSETVQPPVVPPPVVPVLPPVPAVPEPATLLLWGAGLAAGLLWRRRVPGVAKAACP